MNTILKLRLSAIAFLFAVVSMTTQAQAKREPIVSRDGFWVIETSPKNRQSIVRFYSNDQKLIYEETVNRRLNIARQQTKRQLNIALEQAMFVWNATHQVPSDRQWVAIQFDRK